MTAELWGMIRALLRAAALSATAGRVRRWGRRGGSGVWGGWGVARCGTCGWVAVGRWRARCVGENAGALLSTWGESSRVSAAQARRWRAIQHPPATCGWCCRIALISPTALYLGAALRAALAGGQRSGIQERCAEPLQVALSGGGPLALVERLERLERRRRRRRRDPENKVKGASHIRAFQAASGGHEARRG